MTEKRQVYAVRYAPHAGRWHVYRLADGQTISTYPSFGSAFHAMERLERAEGTA